MGQPAFDGNVITTTDTNAIPQVSTDNSLIPTFGKAKIDWGSLDLTKMDPSSSSSLTALKGTKGVDCKLVHGDRWETTHGNQTTNINQRFGTIGPSVPFGAPTSVPEGGSLYLNIDGSCTVEIFGFLDSVIWMWVIQNYHGFVTRHYQQTVVDYYGDDKYENNEKTGWNSTAEDLENCGFNCFHCGLQLEAEAAHFEIALAHFEGKLIHFEYKPVHVTTDKVWVKQHFTKADLAALESKMGTSPQIRAVYDALVDLNVITPMG